MENVPLKNEVTEKSKNDVKSCALHSCEFAYDILRKLFFRCILVSPKRISNYIYKKKFGKPIDWSNPKNLNEKINWLKYFSNTTEWTRLSDKFSVREYICQKGYSDILVPLLAKWDNENQVDFSLLPNSFVIKTNHGSGEVVVVKDKSMIDEDRLRAMLGKYLRRKYGYYQGEPHYMNIKPCIIAEQLLEEKNNDFSSSLVDYKVWCFDGNPTAIWVCYNRSHECTYIGLYDLDWNYHPECSVFNEYYRDGRGNVPKPKSFDRMMKVAADLSMGFPEVRIDFYDIDGVLYFGEMTFTSAGGYMPFFTEQYLLELGEHVILP